MWVLLHNAAHRWEDEDPRNCRKDEEMGAKVYSAVYDAVAALDAAFVSTIHALASERGETPTNHDALYKHTVAESGLEDYAHELAFLSDLSEPSPTTLNYSAPNVQNPDWSRDEQLRLVATLRSHEGIMISGGNALPPPAYGVVCDIDTQGHSPIKQRARGYCYDTCGSSVTC
ncbi:hypothetical protein PC129_g6913 [Phytophthora cactorum]|uniref:Uncharacterized protein n=1 Tax=Phytophthora cactorum TaxID=29920 RepID=A0A329SIE5_9STRA|nr:hypothetical protein Pcac1_g18078 [Phytophthora cactorum]KAG2829325.1 hypothetical protein PC112_g8154 [Phytophthora cactorum]KAG2913122.1 hypothetical protein PC114_g8652 [Phytophthora cactorum]KAG2922890.1 hypothetical protein PC117_g15882 [Phytophthora cactorum]KAG3025179.1 hypothetical protein PC119_g8246 [Phytophthora cactorum]